MTYPDNPITVGQTLQQSIDRIMQQPKTADNIYDDSAFRQFLLTAGANEEQSLVNQLLIYEQAPETAVYITEEELHQENWQAKPESKAFWLLTVQTKHDNSYMKLERAWARNDVLGLGAVVQRKWRLHPHFELQEVEMLRKSYGSITAETLPLALKQAAETEVRNGMRAEEWYDQFRECTGRVSVEEMRSRIMPTDDIPFESDTKIEAETAWLEKILVNAVWLELLSRCEIRFNSYVPAGTLQLQPYCTNEDVLFFLLTKIHRMTDSVFSVFYGKILPKYDDLLSFEQKFHIAEPQHEALPMMTMEDETTCPAMILPDSENEIGGYALQRIEYLEDYEPETYLSYLSGDMLISHAMDIAERAMERSCDIVQKATDGIFEEKELEKAIDAVSDDAYRTVYREIITS